MTAPNRVQAGVTLVELVISMVIISVALTGILIVINQAIRHSADPVVAHQTLAIAESYLEEILLLAYSDPNGTEIGESRATYDDVDDYNGLNDTGVFDQSGSAVVSLSDYNVSIVVSTVTLSGGITAKRVDVTVSGPDSGLTLTGYKTSS